MAVPVAAAKALAAQKSRRQLLALGGSAGLALLGTGLAATGGLLMLSGGAPGAAADDTDDGPVVPSDMPKSGVMRANGWAWPSQKLGINQNYHDGFSIDLAGGLGDTLYSPYDGKIVRAGGSGYFIPGPCQANPGWWRGENQYVVVRHEYKGRVIYSSHSHIKAGSPASCGVKVGDRVAAGQAVAMVGMTGCTSGPHTHFTLSSTESVFNADVEPFQYIGMP